MTSGLPVSLESHVEAQPCCHVRPVTGLPCTSKTEAKSLHPAALLSGALLRFCLHTQPTCYENSQHNPQTMLGWGEGGDRASTRGKIEAMSCIGTCLQNPVALLFNKFGKKKKKNEMVKSQCVELEGI